MEPSLATGRRSASSEISLVKAGKSPQQLDSRAWYLLLEVPSEQL